MQRKFFTWVSLWVILAMLSAPVQGPAAAHDAAAAAPEQATAALTGHVTDPLGNGVEGVTVRAIEYQQMLYLPLMIQPNPTRPTASLPLSPGFGGKGAGGIEGLSLTTAYTAVTGLDGSYAFPSLTAGRYTLTAEKPGILFTPEQQVVSLPTAQTADFQVQSLPPVIAAATEILPPSTGQHLQAVSTDGAVFTYTQSTPELQALDPGDIIVGGVSPAAPYGFLRKVTTVATQGGEVIVTTGPALLEEAIEDGAIYDARSLTPADLQTSTALPGVQLRAPTTPDELTFSFKLENVVLDDLDGNLATKDDQIKANGTIDFELDYEFFLKIEHFRLHKLTFANRNSVRSTIKVYSDILKESARKEVVIARHSFAPVTIMIGVAPVVFVPRLDVLVGVDGKVKVGISAGISHEYTSRAGVSYTYPQGWAPISTIKDRYTFTPPHPTVEASLKGYLGLRFNLYLYGVAGPYVNASPYLELKVTPLETPWWALYAGVDIPAGFRVVEEMKPFGQWILLKLEDYEVAAVKVRRLMAQSEPADRPPAAPTQPQPANAAVDRPTDVDLNWTGSDPDGDRLNYDVYFGAANPPPGPLSTAQATAAYDPGLLASGVRYYWKIVAWDEHGLSTAGPVWSFTTLPGAPGAFAKSSPLDGAANQPTSLLLDWSDSPGATGYAYCYDTSDDGACSSWQSTGSATQALLSGLEQGVTYYWQARAATSGGDTYADGSASAFWSFTTAPASPEGFNKLSPADLAANQPVSLTLMWEQSPGATSYSFCFDTSDDDACSGWQSTGPATQVALNGLSHATTYYWQARAENGGGEIYADGGLSAFWSFTTAGEMIFIPAGDFPMGCDPANNGGYACNFDEVPLHTVTLDAFWIDKTEVTNAQYAGCVAAGACTAPYKASSYSRSSYYGNPLYDAYPVIWVTWYDAQDYCAWAGKRLPTEAEWEKAARGATMQVFPWGDDAPTCDLANFYNTGYCVGDTTPVGSYPSGASPYGVLDIAGNVWEWVQDWWQWDYYAASPTINPTGPITGTNKIRRGGDCHGGDTSLRVDTRNVNLPTDRYYTVGFRCAAPLAP